MTFSWYDLVNVDVGMDNLGTRTLDCWVKILLVVGKIVLVNIV